MSDYLRGIALMTFLLSTLAAALLPARPAAAATALPGISATDFAMWPADYCAKGSGSWTLVGTSGGSRIDLTVTTFSLRAPSGSCTVASTAGAGVFAAWARVEKYVSGTWAVCKSAPWAANSAGTWSVDSEDDDLLLGCGSGSYRLRSENRITYGGSNQYSPPFTSDGVWL